MSKVSNHRLGDRLDPETDSLIKLIWVNTGGQRNSVSETICNRSRKPFLDEQQRIDCRVEYFKY